MNWKPIIIWGIAIIAILFIGGVLEYAFKIGIPTYKPTVTQDSMIFHPGTGQIASPVTHVDTPGLHVPINTEKPSKGNVGSIEAKPIPAIPDVRYSFNDSIPVTDTVMAAIRGMERIIYVGRMIYLSGEFWTPLNGFKNINYRSSPIVIDYPDTQTVEIKEVRVESVPFIKGLYVGGSIAQSWGNKLWDLKNSFYEFEAGLTVQIRKAQLDLTPIYVSGQSPGAQRKVSLRVYGF